MNVHVESFLSYWWLIFPIMWMVFGMVRTALCDAYERRRLDLIHTLAEQGRDIPDALRR